LRSTFFHLALASHLTQCLSLHDEENNPGFAKVALELSMSLSLECGLLLSFPVPAVFALHRERFSAE